MHSKPLSKILFLCMGNICRSPLAEAITRHRLALAGLGERVLVDSAGTESYHVGELADPRARAVGARHGVDLSALRARQLAPDDLQRFDLVLAMDRVNLRGLEAHARRHPGPAERALYLPWIDHQGSDEVPDPYYGNEQHFQAVYELLDEAALSLVERLGRGF